MNSDPNIDSKQCPESKLGQVHSVHPWHKLRAGSAVSWRTRRHVMAFPRSYRSLCPTVSWPCPRRVAARTRALCRDTMPCRRPLLVTIQNLYRDPSPCRPCTERRVAAPSAILWSIAALYCGALLRRIVAHYSAVSQPWRIV